MFEDAHYQGEFILHTDIKDDLYFDGEGEMTLADKTVVRGKY